MKTVAICLLVVLPCMATLSGCKTMYYNTMEKLGVHKRDIMVDRVKDARDSQNEAKEQFKSALEQFTEVLNFKGGDLQAKYDKLNSEYERCATRAEDVHNRIDSVESVSGALFREWKKELKEYSNPSLRKASDRKLKDTKQRYEQLISAMKRAEKKIDPVLSAFYDQVLFLKHNLNAQAIASLQDELDSVENDIAQLISDMEKSITEADAFIDAMTAE